MKKLLVLATLLFCSQTVFAGINSDLVEAAIAGQTGTLKALIGGDADVESDGGTAMISAAFAALERQGSGEPFDGQVKAVQMLVNAGADANAHLDNGLTALMLMAILGQADAVRDLLAAGADVNATNNADGGTALIFAVYGGSTEIVSDLIDAGADINMTDAGSGNGDGRTALSYAEEKAHAGITAVLKQAGAK
jgi:serine/threonine-protein phosphatase 6 regulatory ankyrin repeat subunit B